MLASHAVATFPLSMRPRTGPLGRLRHTLAEIGPLLLDPHGATVRIRTTSGETLTPERVEHAVAALRAAGIGHGDRIIVRAAHGIASVAWFVAVWSLGATLIPVNDQMTSAALAAIAADGQAAAVCDPHSGELTRLPGRVATRFRFTRPPHVTGVDLALIIYTSGSTGNPKGIMLTHANVMAALNAIVDYQRLTPEDRILCVPPLYFDYGLYQILFAFHVGCEVLLPEPPANPVKIIALIRQHQPTVLPIVPAIGSGLAATMAAFRQSIATVRLITNTGGHLPAQTIKGLRDGFPGAEVMPMYGLTESKRALFLPDSQVDHRPGSVGKPMPGLEAKVFVEELQDDGASCYREAAAHEVGQLYVRGASVMQGYSGGADAGARIIPGNYRDDNWLATGDLFCTDDDAYFYYRGRDKDLIKQGGFCLYPREIEAIVEAHPDVLATAVVGALDRAGDEIACLFVRLGDAAHEVTQGIAHNPAQTALRAWLKTAIDHDYLPRQVRFIRDWPLNPNGKIDRNALRQLTT